VGLGGGKVKIVDFWSWPQATQHLWLELTPLILNSSVKVFRHPPTSAKVLLVSSLLLLRTPPSIQFRVVTNKADKLPKGTIKTQSPEPKPVIDSVFMATLNISIPVIVTVQVLLVEENEVPGVNIRPSASYWQTVSQRYREHLTNNVNISQRRHVYFILKHLHG